MQTEASFVLLFAVATGVALIARRLHAPFTVALVVAGLALGEVHVFSPPHLTKQLLYSLVLPGLVFEAAFHLEFSRFWRNRLTILGLALPGVAAAIAALGAIVAALAGPLRFGPGVTLLDGLVFAAAVAATDPIAVVGLFRRLGAPRRLSVIIEGESLLNDGTAIVLFSILVALEAGGEPSIGGAVVDFIRQVGLGLVLGGGIGIAASRTISGIDEPMIEITLTTIAGYGAFAAAEQLHCSGVIATVVSGMVCGNWAAQSGMSPTTRIAVETFWEYVAFALNSIVFLLIGLEVRPVQLVAHARAIGIAWLAVTAVRAAVLGLATLLLGKTHERIPWSWTAVLTWGGLRGALSMVLVLAIPVGMPQRELLVTMTFGVVLLTIVVQGLTMRPLLRRLGLCAEEEKQEYERRRTRVRVLARVRSAVAREARERHLPTDLVHELESRYDERLREAEQRLDSLRVESDELRDEERRAAERALLLLEKRELVDAHRRGELGSEAYARLIAEVDERLSALGEEAGTAPEAEP